jgi:RimJ/RimL family protein N-acetyltransferase
MSKRFEYTLSLLDLVPPDVSQGDRELELSPIEITDAPSLAELMINAYRGTVDDDGETYEDALAEVHAYLNGERGGPPWLTISRQAFVDTRLVGACLVSQWSERQLPIIAYILTRADWKRRGIGRQILSSVLEVLRENGCSEVRAVITEGNEPSENLFLQMGFQRIGTVQ